MIEYKYDAWGKRIGRTGSLAATLGALNPFLYRGYVYDEETQLYYLQSRYYNPNWGRFISPDAVLGQVGSVHSHNLYCYCGNKPLLKSDASGKRSEFWFAICHPFVALDIGQYVEGKRCKNITTTAIRFAISLGLKQPDSAKKEGTQVNAVRHALWTGIISCRYGVDIAREAVRSHENSNMLRYADPIISNSAESISKMRFNSHLEADSMCDILNNEIALSYSWANVSPHEICADILDIYHTKGLWVINEDYNDNGFYIYQECLTDECYNSAIDLLSRLDDYGFLIE